MRTVIVGFMAFVIVAAVLWLCGAFISTIWNPMLWDAFGRSIYVLMVLCIAAPAGVCAGACYEEELRKSHR